MKTKKIKLLNIAVFGIILSCSLLVSKSFAQQQIDSPKNTLQKGAVELLEKYQRFGQFSEDGVSLDQKYIDEFLLLFDKAKFKSAYNDLALKDGGSFNVPEDYVTFVKTNYPQGIDQTLDISNSSVIDFFTKNGFYYVIVKVKKQLTGLYGSKKIHSFEGDLYFFINVPTEKLEKTSEYRINQILSSSKYKKYLDDKSSKGIYVGITGAFEKTKIYSDAVYSSSFWKPSAGSTISPGIDITYMFSGTFGLGVGLSITNYNTSFLIKDYNQKSESTMIDADGDSYNPVLQISSIKEENTIKCFEIPLVLKSRFGRSKTKLYFDLGVIYSMANESYYTLEGSSVVQGFYPQYDITLKDLPEYGYGTYSYSSSVKNKMSTTKQVIFAHTAIGVTHKMGTSLLLKLGFKMNYGLTDLGYDKVRYSSDFNNTIADPIKSSLRSSGIEFGIMYKIH